MGLVTAGLGYFLGGVWPFEIFSHFRLQSVAGLFLVGIALIFLRRRRLAGGCLVGALLLAGSMAGYFLPRVELAKQGPLRVLSFNVNTANTNFTEVLEYVGQQEADVVFLMEVNQAWVDRLEPLNDLYPHRIIQPREDNFGVAVFSKQPFVSEEVLYYSAFDLPAVVFEVVLEGTTYHLIGAHPLPPMNGFNYEARNAELLDLARRIASKPHAIFMGDFNLTPFSPYFREILAISGLRDSANGLGLVPTWNSANPLFAIPIDHMLISKDLAISLRAIGPSLGSDHNPLVLSVTPRKSTD